MMRNVMATASLLWHSTSLCYLIGDGEEVSPSQYHSGEWIGQHEPLLVAIGVRKSVGAIVRAIPCDANYSVCAARNCIIVGLQKVGLDFKSGGRTESDRKCFGHVHNEKWERLIVVA